MYVAFKPRLSARAKAQSKSLQDCRSSSGMSHSMAERLASLGICHSMENDHIPNGWDEEAATATGDEDNDTSVIADDFREVHVSWYRSNNGESTIIDQPISACL